MFRNTPKQSIVSIILALEAALVCVSRVYVGGHYPLDVVGGILLGVGVSLIFIGLEKRIEGSKRYSRKANTEDICHSEFSSCIRLEMRNLQNKLYTC